MASTTEDRKRSSSSVPTEPAKIPLRELRRARAIRRGAVAALLVFVAAGAAGVFGYRTGSVSASGGGYELRLSYPLVGRPGMPIQWILHIHRDGGLPPKVTVGTTLGFLDILDFNDVEPQPDSVTTTTEEVLWTFVAPEGDDMTVILDAFISTNAHRRIATTTSVFEDGASIASVSYETRVSP